MLDNKGYKLTLRQCDNSCFSTAKIVARTLLIISTFLGFLVFRSKFPYFWRVVITLFKQKFRCRWKGQKFQPLKEVQRLEEEEETKGLSVYINKCVYVFYWNVEQFISMNVFWDFWVSLLSAHTLQDVVCRETPYGVVVIWRWVCKTCTDCHIALIRTKGSKIPLPSVCWYYTGKEHLIRRG
jgi:hypothetical protein